MINLVSRVKIKFILQAFINIAHLVKVEIMIKYILNVT